MKKETLREAIEGSSIVFANTDCKYLLIPQTRLGMVSILMLAVWVNGSKEAEVLQGKNIADVVAECGVPFMIWSTLPYASKMTGGKVTSVAHFDSKGEVEEYIRSLGIPASYFVPAFYLQNVKHFMKETNEGLLRLSYTFPSNTPIPVLDPVADTGKFVAALLLHQKQMIGKWILGASGWYTPDDMVTAVAQASGKKVFYQQISDEMLQQILPGTMGVEICGNFELIKDWKYYGLDAEERLDESLKVGMLFFYFSFFGTTLTILLAAGRKAHHIGTVGPAEWTMGLMLSNGDTLA